ncbi:MAG TPA: pyridoxal phosphate-dependent aminotransferase [Hyphomicrobiaceae bacterium]|nr:pyridoxal phosphate-dependent aminotransferase [Hyphomicrobiaceae bacterium]
MPEPRYTAIIRELPSTVPFVGPEAQERARGARFKARIGANESVFGPSPKAIAAVQAAAGETWKYCDPDNHDLIQAIARFHGVAPANVVITEGIDGGLGLANRLFVEPGNAVVTSDGAYPTFNFHVASCGGRLIKVPYRDDREDIEALCETARKADARILYVSNPDNPMGSCWGADEITQLITALPAGTMLVLDEAYVDTAPAGTAPPIDVSNSQVLRFRTFSKAYGLAGARVGYCIGEAGVIANFEKVRNHYGINRLGQIAALAALEDQDYLRATLSRIAESRQRIAAMGHSNGLAPLPSATNFVTLDCGRDGAYAKRIMDGLLARGIFVRMPGVATLNRCIRIGAGLPEDLDRVERELPEVLAEAGGY